MLKDYFYVQLRQSTKVILPLDSTKEVISITYAEVCPIPGVSSALLGVVNQRGKLLWVLDLSDLLKLPYSQKNIRPQENLTLLVLNDPNNLSGQHDRQIGCIVSSLKGVIALDSAEFQPLNSQISTSLKSFASAIALVQDEPVALLDINTILNNIQNSFSSNLVHSL